MHFVQVTSEWLSVGHLLLTTALAIVGGAAWLRTKHVERRADKALETELERSPLPLRAVGEDHARGGELC
jgi:predicted signal transduction protein with EAL and GGDEF domain